MAQDRETPFEIANCDRELTNSIKLSLQFDHDFPLSSGEEADKASNMSESRLQENHPGEFPDFSRAIDPKIERIWRRRKLNRWITMSQHLRSNSQRKHSMI
jgi:hypothetical protein